MTTPIDLEAFLRALDDHPEWRDQVRSRLLTQELIELPNVVAQISSTLNSFMETTEQRLNEIASTLRDFIAATERRFAAMDIRLDQVDARLEAMDTRFEQIDSRLDRMDERFDRIDERFDRIDERFDRMDGHLNRMDGRLNRMDGRLNQAVGTILEGETHRRIVPILSQQLGLTRGRVLHSPYMVTADELQEAIEHDTTLTEQERNRLQVTDLIARARQNNDTLYIAVEASFTVDQTDVTRANESARILQTLFGERTLPVVTGYFITDEGRRQADQAGTLYVEATEPR